MSDSFTPVERVLLPTTSRDEKEFLVDVERYHFACQYVAGKRVLDIASGGGWGTALLVAEGRAAAAVGVEIDGTSVQSARTQHASEAIEFVQGTAEQIPLRDCSVDAAVSIETFEHIQDPRRLLVELSRVLIPGGTLVLSTPRNETPERVRPSNPYHVREYSSAEFESMLRSVFPHVELFSQVTTYADDLVPASPAKSMERLRQMIRAFIPKPVRDRIRRTLHSEGLTIERSDVVAGVHQNSVVQLAVCRTATPSLGPS